MTETTLPHFKRSTLYVHVQELVLCSTAEKNTWGPSDTSQLHLSTHAVDQQDTHLISAVHIGFELQNGFHQSGVAIAGCYMQHTLPSLHERVRLIIKIIQTHAWSGACDASQLPQRVRLRPGMSKYVYHTCILCTQVTLLLLSYSQLIVRASLTQSLTMRTFLSHMHPEWSNICAQCELSAEALHLLL